MTRELRRLAACVLLALALAPAGAYAQAERPGRPYRGLFGPEAQARRSLHEVDLDFSIDAAADNGLLVPDASAGAYQSRIQQLYTAGARLTYRLRGERVGFDASAVSTLPYYSVYRDEPLEVAYGARSALTYTSRSGSLAASGTYRRSPYSSLGLDAGAPPAVGGGAVDYAFARIPNETAGLSASATRQLGRAASVSVSYLLDATFYPEEHRTTRSQGTAVSLGRELSRTTGLFGSYGYRVADYAAGFDTPEARTQSHEIDGGLTYAGRSSRGQPPTFAASAGASMLTDAGAEYSLWRAAVSAGRGFGRNWVVRGSFIRSLQHPGTLQEPVWANTVSANATGLLWHRTDLVLGASYTSGNGVSSSGRGYDTYLGSAQARIAVGRGVALDVGYVYYRYAYPASFDLPLGMPHRLNRHRLLAGVSLWLPVLRSGRSRGPSLAAASRR